MIGGRRYTCPAYDTVEERKRETERNLLAKQINTNDTLTEIKQQFDRLPVGRLPETLRFI
jgi:hypothetical protein